MHLPAGTSLNESPSEKEGKLVQDGDFKVSGVTLNESPSEKEGKLGTPYGGGSQIFLSLNESPSEKEGKYVRPSCRSWSSASLNESPSEKEGKCRLASVIASMLIRPQ